MAEGFRGARVVVTGAAGGIGIALCHRFVAEGAEVVAVDRDEAGLARLVRETDVETAAIDVSNRDQTTDALRMLGPIDVLVNNAGVTALGRAGDIPTEAVQRVMAVNYLGSVNATHALLGSLTERRGRIAVMSSVAGFAPLVNRTAYSASKHALHGYFESLRAELVDTGVSVTMVCPAFADTGIGARAVARSEGETGEWTTTGRHLSAEQVADAVIDGVRKRKRLVLPGATARAAYWTWRFAPGLYERLMRSRVR
ncbi:MAG: SDR family oxidoreductase [Actinomycetota bacterium]